MENNLLTLVSRIAAHVLQFFFRKFCPYFRSIRDYAFNNFQKKIRKYSNKIQFHSNSYAFIRNPSTLCLYEIFEMVNPLLLFHTVPQYESLEYYSTMFSTAIKDSIVLLGTYLGGIFVSIFGARWLTLALYT